MARSDRTERGVGPPILTLLATAREHRAAFAYDWRTRFGIPFDPPRSNTYAEAWHLTQALLNDPTSHVAAAVGGWSHPWSWEAAAIADLYDLMQHAHTDRKHKARIKPYPRPWPTQDAKKYRPKVSQERVRAALAARGH